MNKKIRILCVDDEQEISAMLDLYKKQATAQIENIGTVNNLREALDKIAKDLPDIVVVDLSVANSDPVETIQSIAKRFPKIHVILYSNQDDQTAVHQAIKAGACKHVHKGHGMMKLLDAIYEAAAGVVSKVADA